MLLLKKTKKEDDSSKTLLIEKFSELVRKIWNKKNFKNQVSPHEFMQAIALKSNKRFSINI